MASDIPQSGWTTDSVEDIGEAIETCEYCSKERIRFVHILSHPTHPTIRVGCVCAEQLTGDSINPKARENKLKSRAQTFSKWLKSKNWIEAEFEHVREDGPSHWCTHLRFYFKSGYWWWQEIMSPSGISNESALCFNTVEEAKRDYWMRELAPK